MVPSDGTGSPWTVELVELESAVVDEGGWPELGRSLYNANVYGEVCPGALGVMVMPYHWARRWDRIGAVSVL